MTYKEIKRLVEKATGIQSLSNKKRTRHIADARFVYYALCMRYSAGKSNSIISTELRRIGAHVGRDRTTVIHGLKEFNNLSLDPCWHGKWLYKLCIELMKNQLRERALNLQWKIKKPIVKNCTPVQYGILK